MAESAASHQDKQILDEVIGMALLDTRVHEQLLNGGADELLLRLGLSLEMRDWLGNRRASSLEDLAKAILAEYFSE